jgi:hypothetical protein
MSAAEVLHQLASVSALDAVVEVLAQAPDAAGVGIDRLGLQALQLQVLEIFLTRCGTVTASPIDARAREE